MHSLHVTLNPVDRSVTLKSPSSTKRFGKKWLAFYLLLTQHRGRTSEWVTAEHVHRLSSWHLTAFASVGKQIRAHIRTAESQGLVCIDANGITRQWRLRADVSVSMPPDVDGDACLKALTAPVGSLLTRVEWLEPMVLGQLALCKGDLAKAAEMARQALNASDDVDLVQVAGLLLIRASVSGPHTAVNDVYETVRGRLARVLGKHRTPLSTLWREDAIGRFCANRVAALEALNSPDREIPKHLTSLSRRLNASATAGDLSSRAIIGNVTGRLLDRLTTRREQAILYLSDAAVAALAVSDLYTIGGILLHWAQILLKPSPSRECLDEPIRMLRLSIRLNETVGVGLNSAQVEILLARVHIERQDVDDARQWLTTAAAMVQRSGSVYDAACLANARARFLALTRADRADVQEALIEAEVLFRKAGRHQSAARVRRELRQPDRLSLRVHSA